MEKIKNKSIECSECFGVFNEDKDTKEEGCLMSCIIRSVNTYYLDIIC